MPTPNKSEKQDEFISRCMGDATMTKDFPDSPQRAGVCYKQWRERDTPPKKAAASATVTALRQPRPAPAGYKLVHNAAQQSAEICLYGMIGDGFFGDGISSDRFIKDIRAIGNLKALDLRINSEGGDVFHAKAIYALLMEHPAKVTVHIDGLAASAASYIAMAGDQINMADGAFMMIHNASAMVMGTAAELERTIALLKSVDQTLVSVYAKRCGMKPAAVQALMDAETWMNAQDAVEKGFADAVTGEARVAAAVRDPSRYAHLPDALRANSQRASAALASIAAQMALSTPRM
jgi:ATP-dependent protease ClpP protease subunit